MTVSSLLRTGAVALTLTTAAASTVLLTAGASSAENAKGDNRAFTAPLSGENEVDNLGNGGVGDPDGAGNAVVKINDKTGELCFKITTRGVSTIVAAHIHEAGAGKNGPIVQGLYSATSTDLTTMGTQILSDCVPVPAVLRAEIRSEPADYYVNVHTTQFRAGAIRAQLAT